MKVRTRFSPSPSGSLHLGNIRTALYCWLYANKYKGDFILRIEDTDFDRSCDIYIQNIFDTLNWLGLFWTEGPYYQMKRLDIYNEILKKLLHEGKAYKCYCKKERLNSLRLFQLKNKMKPKYDKFCRDLKTNLNRSYVVRFKNPDEGNVHFVDGVYGDIIINNCELDDLIIFRSDGIPTYNFVAVIDDIDMKITDVIRGADHITNTARQINIYNSLGVDLPKFYHIPIILNDIGKRLSKRLNSASIIYFHNSGYLSYSLLNYLLMLGWSYYDKEIFNIDEMIEFFNIEKLHLSSVKFNYKKLLWYNKYYIRNLSTNYIIENIVDYLKKINIVLEEGPNISLVFLIQKFRISTFLDFIKNNIYFYKRNLFYDSNLNIFIYNKFFLFFDKIYLCLFNNELNWNISSLKDLLIKISVDNNIVLNDLYFFLRIIITGVISSPSLIDVIFLIGKKFFIYRINSIKYIYKLFINHY
ncbi:MAG TPA: glutamate--tRNA ligase [Candidatus Azosocius sp. HAIN]